MKEQIITIVVVWLAVGFTLIAIFLAVREWEEHITRKRRRR